MGDSEIVGGNWVNDGVGDEIKEKRDDRLLGEEKVDLSHVDVEKVSIRCLGELVCDGR